MLCMKLFVFTLQKNGRFENAGAKRIETFCSVKIVLFGFGNTLVPGREHRNRRRRNTQLFVKNSCDAVLKNEVRPEDVSKLALFNFVAYLKRARPPASYTMTLFSQCL